MVFNLWGEGRKFELGAKTAGSRRPEAPQGRATRPANTGDLEV